MEDSKEKQIKDNEKYEWWLEENGEFLIRFIHEFIPETETLLKAEASLKDKLEYVKKKHSEFPCRDCNARYGCNRMVRMHCSDFLDWAKKYLE